MGTMQFQRSIGTVWRLGALLAGVSLAGCETKAATTSAPTSTSNTPAAPAAPAANPPPETVGTVEPATSCPDPAMKLSGEPSKGWVYAWCESSGSVRLADVKVKDRSDDGVTLTITNRSKDGAYYVLAYLYLYDKSGKQLDIASKDGQWTGRNIDCSVNKTPSLKPGESYDLVCLKSEIVPKDAKVEAEVSMMKWNIGDNQVEWRNPSLTPKERPIGGMK
jgi:hypothetical protein